MSSCQCCGYDPTQDSQPLVVDLGSNTVTFHTDGASERLEPQLCEALYAIARDWPRIAPIERISHAVWGCWGNDDLENPARTLRVYVTKLRRKLEPHGVDLFNVWGRGYGIRRGPSSMTPKQIASRKSSSPQASA
jgi:DNA-binding response OmpR family regulator